MSTVTIKTSHKQYFEVGEEVQLVVNTRPAMYRVTSETREVRHPGVQTIYTYELTFLQFDLSASHLTDYDTFKSDKYDWCPEGFFALKFSDPAARAAILCYAAGTDDPKLAEDLRRAVEVARGKALGGLKA